MTIKQLNEEQVRTWTVEEKDRWWLKEVFRGNMPQLTVRSALAGMLIGGVMSLTNLYVGMKTGWTLGVGITSVIIAFTVFKIMQKLGLASEFTVLENNCMQSIATAAGYMTSPLIASLAAYGSFGKKCPIEKSKYTAFHRVYCSLHGTFFMGWAIHDDHGKSDSDGHHVCLDHLDFAARCVVRISAQETVYQR